MYDNENSAYSDYLKNYRTKLEQKYLFKVVMRKDKATKKDGALRPLFIRRTLGSKVMFESLNMKVLPSQWDEEQSRVKKNHPECAELNKTITERLLRAQTGLFKADNKDAIEDPSGIQNPDQMAIKEAVEKALAAERLKHQKLLQTVNELTKEREILRSKIVRMAKAEPLKKSITFSKFADEYLSRLKNPGTHRANASAVSMFKDFLKTDVQMHEITVQTLRDYQDYIASGNASSTVHRKLKVVRAIFHETERLDHIKENPFLRFKMPSFKTSKMQILTDAQLLELKRLDVAEKLVKWYHLQAYFLACHCGLRISDICTLTWEKVKDGRLNVTTHKTCTDLSFALPPEAIKILEKLRKLGQKEADYVFPFLTNGKQYTPKQRMLETSRETALINKNLNTDVSRTHFEQLMRQR